MADHTIVNLQDVEDAAAKFGMPPGLEARFARSALGLEKSGVTLFKAGPEFKIPGGIVTAIRRRSTSCCAGARPSSSRTSGPSSASGTRCAIPANVARSFRAGPDGAEVLAFGAGEQGDAEMIKDFW